MLYRRYRLCGPFHAGRERTRTSTEVQEGISRCTGRDDNGLRRLGYLREGDRKRRKQIREQAGEEGRDSPDNQGRFGMILVDNFAPS